MSEGNNEKACEQQTHSNDEAMFREFKENAKSKVVNILVDSALKEFKDQLITIFWPAITIGVLGSLVANLAYDLFVAAADDKTKFMVLIILLIFITTPYILFSTMSSAPPIVSQLKPRFAGSALGRYR